MIGGGRKAASRTASSMWGVDPMYDRRYLPCLIKGPEAGAAIPMCKEKQAAQPLCFAAC